MSPPRTYQDEPAVSDYRRSADGYGAGSGRNSEPDREISLSTPSILGLFFALAVVCGCIYALGFAMGRRSTPPIPVAVTDTTLAPSTGSPKPDAGQAPIADTTTLASAATQPTTAQASAAQSSGSQTATVPLAPPATPAASAAAPAALAAPPAASFMVQVAAVSSQDVADILIGSLKKKGYDVAVHQEPQDKLLHVQIGPFADRKDAEAMRQRVLTDGFNAIVK